MIDAFRARFGTAEGIRVFRAPGRVNLIGEHTDYNLGFVLPMSLHLATYVATAPSANGKLRIYSEQRDETVEWDAAAVPTLTPQKHWSDYAIGVAQELARLGSAIAPANLLVRSTVPEGSGLSSSAAFEVSCALAFLNGRAIEPLELARLCQRSERNFVGIPCGIMDQYVSVFGRDHAAVRIDCRSLECEYVELPSDAAFVAVNSMVKHALASSAYIDRVNECAAAVEIIHSRFHSVESLRDVTPEQFRIVEPLLPPLVARRARHVITEDARVEAFVEASPNAAAMGELMVLSHRSLRDDYEVSCAELDFLVDTALAQPGVYGSRMTGGGFGGCTVTMLRPDAVESFGAAISTAYERAFQVTPRVYLCQPSAGAGEVTRLETIPPA